jgi:hypothetical protein
VCINAELSSVRLDAHVFVDEHARHEHGHQCHQYERSDHAQPQRCLTACGQTPDARAAAHERLKAQRVVAVRAQ